MARTTLRLCLVATATATVFEGILLAVGGLAVADHWIIGGLIVGSAVASLLAARGRAQAAALVVILTLWGAAVAALFVHGIRATALPTLTISTILAALWGGPRLAIALIAASAAVLVAASGALGSVLPPPVVVDPVADTIVIVGQFVFLAVLVAFLGRSIGEVRRQIRAQDSQLARATEELEATRTARQETEARYAELVQALPDTVFLFGADGTILETNATIEQLVGVKPEDVIGTKPGEYGLLDPDEAVTVYHALRRVLEGEPVPPLVLPLRHRDGSIRWVEGTTRRVAGPAGTPRVLAIVRDITDRREAEQGRRVLAQAVEWAQGGMSMTDPTGVLTYVNDAFVRMWGYESAAQCVGRHALEFWADKDAALKVISAVKDEQRFLRGTLKGRRADGTTFDAELAVNVVYDEDGRMIGMLGSFADVTDREQLEERLRETQKLESIGRLAGGVAHDFNNLLTAILGYAEELVHDSAPDSQVAADAGEIVRAAERARGLTTQLLMFARRQVTQPRVLDVRRQLDGMTRFLERLLGEDVRLVLEVAADAGAVRMDPSHLEQVMLNLAANARDAMPDGGTLSIVARPVALDGAAADARRLPSGEYLRLEVRDTGEGMTPEVAGRIFEPFFTTKEIGRGTGLGLATVYGIVQQASGQIDVASAPGAGTTFVLHLPRVHETADAEESSAPSDVRGGCEEILLIEDEKGVRDYATRVLGDAGYRLTTAGSAAEAEALAQARGRAFDLIVTDVVMPDVNGPVLVERLVAAFGPMPVLYVSGYTEDRLSDQRLGGDRVYLPKPYGRQALLTQVRQMLDAAVT